MEPPICHCFGYTESAIQADVAANGRSLILEKIEKERRLGRCRCVETHPEKR